MIIRRMAASLALASLIGMGLSPGAEAGVHPVTWKGGKARIQMKRGHVHTIDLGRGGTFTHASSSNPDRLHTALAHKGRVLILTARTPGRATVSLKLKHKQLAGKELSRTLGVVVTKQIAKANGEPLVMMQLGPGLWSVVLYEDTEVEFSPPGAKILSTGRKNIGTISVEVSKKQDRMVIVGRKPGSTLVQARMGFRHHGALRNGIVLVTVRPYPKEKLEDGTVSENLRIRILPPKAPGSGTGPRDRLVPRR